VVGVHEEGSYAGWIRVRVKQRIRSRESIVAAVLRLPSAPATAAGDLSVNFGNEVGPVRNQLPVNGKDRTQRRVDLVF